MGLCYQRSGQPGGQPGKCYYRYRPMDQASRIIAQWTGVSDVISHERIACAAWKRAVGKKVALRTRALKLVRTTLVVEVDDETWRKNLWSLRYQILHNLEKALGPEIVTAVELRVMPPRFGPQREEQSTPGALDEAESIVDPGLRRIYKAARRRETA
jgi:Dna[CI] antecedent, DciA